VLVVLLEFHRFATIGGYRQASVLGGGQASCFGSGARTETRGPHGRERGVGFLGRGQLVPYTMTALRSAVSSPSGVRGRVPAAKRFPCILEAPHDDYLLVPGTQALR